MLEGKQAELIVTVVVGLRQIRVVVAQEDRPLTVDCRHRQGDLEKPFAVWEVCPHGLAVNQEDLDDPAPMAVPYPPAQLHLVLVTIRDFRPGTVFPNRHVNSPAGRDSAPHRGREPGRRSPGTAEGPRS